jgi:hypothetical protein
MNSYEKTMEDELRLWQRKMVRKPGVFNRLSKKLQDKINSWIPEKVHKAITVTIKQMIRAMLFGAEKITRLKPAHASLEQMDAAAKIKIDEYRKTAAVEGAVTGAGGIFLGLADFPILLAIKLKLLFEIATIYNFPVNDYKERLYMLHIFQLAFSSDQHRREVYLSMQQWDQKAQQLPDDIHQFDWRNFQQQYRDYIDLAKMAQLLPVIGAPVGAYVNYQLLKKLGVTAIRAYHMRML